MNSTKAHIAALSLLDRALIAVTDDELAALLAGLPEDHTTAVKRICDLRDEDADLVEAVRIAAHKGRLNGDLQRLGVVLSDACLADCLEQLGDAADMPTEEELQAVIPGLIERHGLGFVRVMLAATVVGEAPVSAMIVGLLKTDETVKLAPVELKQLAPLLPPKADDEERLRLKAQRKERKAQEQAEAKLRRDQVARARNRV
ncbi:MAG: hypothetical protein F2735_07690 [Actinobacteria bacterium]|uniref:Unannotated protein n=1 Tax=freshwater metagenome TaxID=449393 RepID=A0A6J6YU33_9ZZZZ|nr:hypothetical protein [Actinomycetota bacterium]